MIKSNVIFLLFILVLCFSGCGSAIPYATTFPLQTQRKMQAAKHWQILAEDVALQIRTCIASRKDLMVKPVYVIPKTATPFEEIFREILTSKLVSSGVLVVKTEKRDVLKLEYSVKLLKHKDREYSKFPMKFTALGAGVMVARGISDWILNDIIALGAGAGLLADVTLSHHAGAPSEQEAIITTALSYDDYFFMHQSDIYYINDPDAGHYVEAADPSVEESTTMNVVSGPLTPRMAEKNNLKGAPGSQAGPENQTAPVGNAMKKAPLDKQAPVSQEGQPLSGMALENSDPKTKTAAPGRTFNVVD